MGVEVVGADIAQKIVKDGVEGDKVFENKADNAELNLDSGVIEPIKFGSHGGDVPVKGDGESVSDNFPKNAVEEWPEPKKVPSLWFVKIRPYEDPKLKVKIEYAEKELSKKNQARFKLTEAIKEKRSERAQIISQLKPLGVENKKYRSFIGDRRKEIEPLNQALGKLRNTNTANREKGVVICSSEEELDDLIRSLNYRIQHESNTLVEEKQILREIKQLEGTRDRVIANAAVKAEIQESLGQKEDIQDQVKLLGSDMDGMRKDQQAVKTKIKHLEEELKRADNGISSLQEELTALSDKRDKAYEGLVELRKQRDEGNAHFYQNRSILNNAKDLASKRSVAALEELSELEVEKFMSQWNSNKSYRTDYEKRILSSLDIRQMSRDGRIRNPDEKLLVEAPVQVPLEPEAVAKPNIKRAKEDPKPSPPQEALPARKVKKEESETNKKVDEVIDKENVSVVEKSQKESVVVNPVDTAKMKEMKREEEIAKAKMALERKKKLAEKAAAKAAIRAQKEAEKKLKEREKRAKKKAGVTSSPGNSEEQTEAEDEVAEPEKAEVNIEAAPPSSKPKEKKETVVRHRGRGKGQDTLPKSIIRRKKSTPYWVWAAPVAVVVVLLLALGYYYYMV